FQLLAFICVCIFFFSSRRRHTRSKRDWSSDVCSSDLVARAGRDAVLNNLSKLRERYKPDAVIVNIENAAHGFGASPSICRQFLRSEERRVGKECWSRESTQQ